MKSKIKKIKQNQVTYIELKYVKVKEINLK